MAERRFGPTNGAGTVIKEKQAQAVIEQGALGTTAYSGIMEKGPIGKMFGTLSKTDLLFRAG